MLCQMAENERVELAGEAGVFPSLLPDNAPSGTGDSCRHRLPANWGEQTLAVEADREKWDGAGDWENEWGRYYPSQKHNKVESCVEREKSQSGESPKLRL